MNKNSSESSIAARDLLRGREAVEEFDIVISRIFTTAYRPQGSPGFIANFAATVAEIGHRMDAMALSVQGLAEDAPKTQRRSDIRLVDEWLALRQARRVAV
ncbi:hypothetical protein SCP_1700640 [Sparassis crispa]|uniref:Uncharacterized protein n=1 Tax=Sparassis crispa TaxID=139825 RepID=A0A401H5S6_9APHY|nr:hypothetical protein SCP_1700640 [Sparassis crispa]GBE89739.1 hypothetical protein SCP_1700640 [Sparassis crispa]